MASEYIETCCECGCATRRRELAASPCALRVETKKWLSQYGWRPHEPYACAADLLRRWLAEAKP